MGIAGDLYVSGPGLARGYLNRPEITAEKFVADPFGREPGARMYKTGDLARYLATGEIEFAGRTDDQVKIRGYRVELEEIEAVLGAHAGVREVVVVARENASGEKNLVAYVVPSREQVPTASELRSYLKQKLPHYMVPSAFVLLEAMPKTPNGKVDKRGAAGTEGADFAETQEYVAPTNELEIQLTRDLGNGARQETNRHSRQLLRTRRTLAAGGAPDASHRAATGAESSAGGVVAGADDRATFRAFAAGDVAGVHGLPWWRIQPRRFAATFLLCSWRGRKCGGLSRSGEASGERTNRFTDLQPQGLDGKRECLTSIPEMAETVHQGNQADSARRAVPHRRLFVRRPGGLRNGADAQAQGEEIALLALFDTYPGKMEVRAVRS